MRPLLALAILLATGLLAIALQANRRGTAQQRAASAHAELQRVQTQVREVTALQQQRELVSPHQRPTRDVLAQVNAILAEAGIPSTQFRSLEQESDTALATSAGSVAERYRRQSLRLALQSLTPGQLGAFLHEWRNRPSVWTTTRIELTHTRGNRSDSDRYDVQLRVAAVYLSDGSSAR